MKLTNKQLKQIIAEELRSILKEGVYVKPGWEPEEDEYEKEIQQMFADDPEALKKFKELTAGTDDNLAASMGQANYPEIDPDKEETKFGVMSGTHGDVPWKDLWDEMPFRGGYLKDGKSMEDVQEWLGTMATIARKYPTNPDLFYKDDRTGLEVDNLALRTSREGGLVNLIWSEVITFNFKTIRLKISEAKDFIDKNSGMPEVVLAHARQQIKFFEDLERKLDRLKEWVGMQSDMFLEYFQDYKLASPNKPLKPAAIDKLRWGKHRKAPTVASKVPSGKEIDRIVEEEIAAVIGEADVYVPPGYETEDEEDDYDAEMAAFFAEDPEALEKLQAIMGGSKGAMVMGDFPKVGPEAEEATFGVMSNVHSGIDWWQLTREMPFYGGLILDGKDLNDLENWIVKMLKLAFKYPIDQDEFYGDSDRMDLEVKNLVVRGTDDQENAAMIWNEIEDLKDYYIFPILEKFRKSYKEPEDIKLIKKLETYNKALHRISEWSAVQGDMYDEYLRSYKKKFARPPAEPVGQRLPLTEDEDGVTCEDLESVKGFFMTMEPELISTGFDLLETFPSITTAPEECGLEMFRFIEDKYQELLKLANEMSKDELNSWSEAGKKFNDYIIYWQNHFPPRDDLIQENSGIEGWAKIKQLFDAASSEEDYNNALHLAQMYKENFPLTGEDEGFMDEIFFNAAMEVPMEHWDVYDRIEKVWGKSVRQYLKEKDPSWDGN